MKFLNDIVLTGAGADLTAPATVTFSGLSTTTETSAVVVNSSGVLSKRALGSNAFTSDTVAAPTSLVTSVVNDTINVTFTASTTADVSQYLVFSSVAGGDYGLISVIPPADFASTISIIDNSFDVSGTQAYRVYAVKNGNYSSPLTGSRSFSTGTVEITTMSVVNLNKAYYVQWNPPSSKGRFVTAYNVYKHQHATQGSLAEGSASLVYSGLNTNFMYTVSGNSSDFHQFWVTTTVA
jgi:hypothetical protein